MELERKKNIDICRVETSVGLKCYQSGNKKNGYQCWGWDRADQCRI